MTNEEIISEIAFEDATPELKEATVDSIRTVVELRVINILSELITDEQEEKLKELTQGEDSEQMWAWLRNEVVGVDVREVYEATLKDYLGEYKEKESQFLAQ